MAKEIRFFATKSDLLSILRETEEMMPVKYIRTGSYSAADAIEGYKSLLTYENLGINISGDHQNESFLVIRAEDSLTLNDCCIVGGSRRYFVDQLKNEQSVVLWPGGVYGGKFLVHGHIGTIHTNTTAKKLYGVFQKAIKKQCNVKVNGFYISSDVLNLHRSGCRLITINVRQSPEYDLHIME